MPQKSASSKPTSTQEHINVSEIRDGIMILKDGGMRMVILSSAVNFSLKSENEQNAIISRYQGFLNSLSFPVQVLMQSRRLDLERYLQRLETKLKEVANELIQLQINDYVAYVRKLITIANIMDKRFYVVVPYNSPRVQSRSFFDKLFHPTKNIAPVMSENEFNQYKEELIERVNTVSSELHALGVKTVLLSTQQIIELLYSSYNIEEASKERLIEYQELSGPAIMQPTTAKKEEKGEVEEKK